MDTWTEELLKWIDKHPTWSRERVAREAGMHSSNIHHWAIGRNTPSEMAKARIDKIIRRQESPIDDVQLRNMLLRYPGMDMQKAECALVCIRAIAKLEITP